MKMRNGANSAWISLYELDGTFLASDISLAAGSAAAPSLFFTGDTNTGIYSPGADQLAITTGGTSRLAVSTTAVSSTLAVDVPLGAVGTPSITFTGDLNTGLFSPGADTLALVTGGINRVHVTSGGLVGIGTTGPQAACHVNGAILSSSALGALSASNIFFDQVTSVLSRIGVVGANTSTTGALTISQYSSNGSVGRDVLIISSAGNVGIGTSSPSSLLHLADAGHITVGTTTGTKIGTATTQRLGFYDATPVVQPTAVADATTAVDVITQLNALLAKLRTLGIIAT
jgi:hypothetical protein